MKNIILVIVFCFAVISLKGQSEFFRNPPLTISFYSHSIGVPFKDFIKKPLNFGVAIGTEFTYNRNDANSLHQKLEIGWYHHHNLSTALWIKTDLLYRYTASGGVYGEVQTGVGYIHDFNAQQTFELQEGQYQAIQHQGKGGLLIGAGIGTGYELELNDNYNIAPFIRYEGLIQTPYSKFQSTFPHTLFHVGSRFIANEN